MKGGSAKSIRRPTRPAGRAATPAGGRLRPKAKGGQRPPSAPTPAKPPSVVRRRSGAQRGPGQVQVRPGQPAGRGKPRIDEMIADLKADPKGGFFEIEGHTDNVGRKDRQRKLGLQRAEAVKRYLYESYQIPLHRMNVISYGEEKPSAPNNTKAGREQNRRVVIRVLA